MALSRCVEIRRLRAGPPDHSCLEMTVAVRQAFDRAAATYDRTRRQLVPDLDRFYGAVPDLLPYRPDEEITVLDPGAGTGLLTQVVAHAFPAARFTLVDLSSEMLEVARARFADGADRCRFIVADYAELELPREQHAVISGLSIHHLPHEGKRRLFGRIRGALRRGGVFVNAEQVRGATPSIEAEYDRWWLTQARAAGVAEAELASAIERMREDRTAPLADQLGWLSEAGFDDVRCAYENRRFAVTCGRVG